MPTQSETKTPHVVCPSCGAHQPTTRTDGRLTYRNGRLTCTVCLMTSPITDDMIFHRTPMRVIDLTDALAHTGA